MKRLISIAVFILTGICTGFTQQVGETSQSMVQGPQNALYLDFTGTSSSFIDKTWRDYISQYGKPKKVKKGNEWLVEGTQVMDIGGVNTVNIYARSDGKGSDVRHYVWVETGGEFVSSSRDANAYNGAVKLLNGFAHKVRVDLIALDLDAQQKALDNLDKDLQKLKRENDAYHKEIEQAKDRIAKAETNIVKNTQDQQLRMQEIEAQKTKVEEVRRRLDTARTEKN